MKKLLLCFFVFATMACSSNLGYNEAIEKNNKKLTTDELRGDALFLVDAKSYSLLLHELGQQATQNGYSSAIQSYGTQLMQQHEQMNAQLQQLAKNEKVSLPVEMSDSHKQMLDNVKNASRQEFDRRFIRTVERVYEDKLDMYKNTATAGNNDEIRAFAARYLRLIRDNQQKADQLEDGLI